MNPIFFPDNSAIASYDLDLTPEQIEAATELLKAGLALREKENKLTALLPPNYYSQFYGNWDCLRIKFCDPKDNEPDN